MWKTSEADKFVAQELAYTGIYSLSFVSDKSKFFLEYLIQRLHRRVDTAASLVLVAMATQNNR